MRAGPGRAQPDGLRNIDVGAGIAAARPRRAAIQPRFPCYKAGIARFPMQLISIPANPVPEGATVGTVKTADGALLRFARFAPPPGRKGTLCVFPGRAEFIEKYFEVVRD